MRQSSMRFSVYSFWSANQRDFHSVVTPRRNPYGLTFCPINYSSRLGASASSSVSAATISSSSAASSVSSSTSASSASSASAAASASSSSYSSASIASSSRSS